MVNKLRDNISPEFFFYCTGKVGEEPLSCVFVLWEDCFLKYQNCREQEKKQKGSC
jgi:hypothetical protein